MASLIESYSVADKGNEGNAAGLTETLEYCASDMILFAGLSTADLQCYGQIAFTLLERLVSAAQTWERFPVGFKGPPLVAIGMAGAAVLLC